MNRHAMSHPGNRALGLGDVAISTLGIMTTECSHSTQGCGDSADSADLQRQAHA